MMLIIFNPKTINEVVAKFFIKILPKISGDPDYESLNEIIQALYFNTATLPTTLSGVKQGRVVLILKYVLYAKLATGTPLEDPDNPGSIPTIAKNDIVAHRQQVNEKHSE